MIDKRDPNYVQDVLLAGKVKAVTKQQNIQEIQTWKTPTEFEAALRQIIKDSKQKLGQLNAKAINEELLIDKALALYGRELQHVHNAAIKLGRKGETA